MAKPSTKSSPPEASQTKEPQQPQKDKERALRPRRVGRELQGRGAGALAEGHAGPVTLALPHDSHRVSLVAHIIASLLPQTFRA